MKRYIVTGGAGFIGSHLVRRLLAEGDGRVEVIDNCFTGSLDNLAEVSHRITYQDCDIRNYEAVARIVAGADAVFHLAAVPSVPRSIREPLSCHDININGAFSVFRACAEGGVRRVVYAASSSAYGNQQVSPKVETMTPAPLSPYAVQKLTGEYYVKVFKECWNLDVVGLRFFNVFGPQQNPSSPYSGVVSVFAKHLLARRAPTIHGDGGQTRDFTYVEDVTNLVVKAARAEGVGGYIVNAGTGNSYSLNQVWSVLTRMEGVDIAPLYGPARQGDVRDSRADIGLAVRLMNHAPQFSLEEGLRRTVAWYRQTRAASEQVAPLTGGFPAGPFRQVAARSEG